MGRSLGIVPKQLPDFDQNGKSKRRLSKHPRQSSAQPFTTGARWATRVADVADASHFPQIREKLGELILEKVRIDEEMGSEGYVKTRTLYGYELGNAYIVFDPTFRQIGKFYSPCSATIGETNLHEVLMSQSQVQNFLNEFHRWDRAISVTNLILYGIAVAILAVIGLFGLDAFLGFPSWVRLVCDLALIGMLAFGAVSLWRFWRDSRFHPQRVARKFEDRIELNDNLIVNAIDLEQSQWATTSPSLRREAIGEAQKLVSRVSPYELVDFRGFGKMGLAALGTLLFALVGWLVAPKLVERVFPRFLNPFGNHPPYSLLQFEVTVSPDKAIQGDSVKIAANLDGAWLPKVANLILVDQDSQEVDSIPMKFESKSNLTVELPKLRSDFQFRVQTDRGDSDLYQVRVYPRPRLQKVIAQFEYPGYSRLPMLERVLDGRAIRAVQGTKISLAAESDLQISTGTMTLESSGDSTEIPLQIVEPTRSTAIESFDVAEQKRILLSVSSLDLVPMAQPWQARIETFQDQPPMVRIASPESFSIAVEGWKVPVEIEAQDDLGLNQLQLLHRANDEEFELAHGESGTTATPSGERTMNLKHELDLEQLGAKSGDVIEYFASASDLYPADQVDGDRHLVKTNIHAIRVISMEEYVELARQDSSVDEWVEELSQIQQQIDELAKQKADALEKRKELQEKLESGQDLEQSDLTRMDQLQKSLEDFEKKSNQLAEELKERAEQPDLFDFEAPVKERLKELAEQLAKQSEQASTLNQQLKNQQNKQNQPLTAEEKKQAANELAKSSEQFKKNQNPFGEENSLDEMEEDLETLAKAAEFMDLSMQMQDITARQRQIADELTEFRKEESLTEEQQRRMQRLAKDQDMLKQELNDSLDKMYEVAEKHEADFPKGAESLKNMADKIDELDVLADQQQSAESAFEEQGAEAQQAAKSAAEKLESLTSENCKNCNGQSLSEEMGEADCPFSIPKEKLQDSLRQLAKANQQRGAGQKPGQGQGMGQGGTGFGQSGMSAEGMSGNFGQGKLSRAQGFHEMQQNGSLFGPQNKSSQTKKSRGREKNGNGGEDVFAGENSTPESLTPESGRQPGAIPGNLQGVPTPFIEHVRAYMQRLNEQPHDAARDQK